MDAATLDAQIRLAAFSFLDRYTSVNGELVPRSVLASGFVFDGERVALVGPQGIFKPVQIRTGIPLTITTAAVVPGRERPYEDEVTEDGLLLYRYRGTDPMHHENVGLRRAMAGSVPLVYLHGITTGSYLPQWPVYVVADDPASLSVTVAVDDPRAIRPDLTVEVADEARRRYVTRLALHRLHQVAFRERVLRAYRQSCALCRLRHPELLDAAHILPDGHPLGEPVVPNGLALCKLHHAAFDRNILGIRPDLVIEVRRDILDEVDGPMLRHGLQALDGNSLVVVPRQAIQRPNPDNLEARYELFRHAG